MSQKILTELTFTQSAILFLRNRRILIFAVLMFSYNRGHNVEAIRTAISIMLYKRLHLDSQGIPYSPHTAEYQQLFSMYNIDNLAHSISVAIVAGLVGLFFHWFLSHLNVPDPQQENQDEIEKLRLWKQNEINSLDAQGRLVRTLKKDQIVKETTLETVERLETLLLRYEQNAIALTPSLNKIVKDRPKQDKFSDLFDQLEQPTEKQKRSRERARRISVKFKT